MNKPSALHVARGIDPRLGGTSYAVPALAEYIAKTGRIDCTLAVFRTWNDLGDTTQMGLAESSIHQIPWNSRSPSHIAAAYRQLAGLVRSHDVIHVHGLWQSHTAMAAHLANSIGKPYIISAHGMLDSWALRNKRWKKRIYAAIVERRNLQRATCLCALTRTEVDNYRAFGLYSPIVIVPNGVALPGSLSPKAFYQRWPELIGKRIVLFLSRIHHKKGLDILCHAWRSVSASSNELHLVLAGPDSEGTQNKIEALVREQGLSKSVTFTGMLDSEMKWSALSACTLFVLPSYSEGFSVAVLEALAAAKPVVITRQCNFPDLAGREFAAVIEPIAGQLEGALRAFLGQPSSLLYEYGAAARDYVQRYYSWPSIGNAMADVYLWMLGGTVPPNIEMIAS